MKGEGLQANEVMQQKKTNHFRAEEYRMQFENERSNNERLQDENLRLRGEFEIYDRDMKDKERRYINRDRV